MNSITEFASTDESVIVNRVLLTLHTEIDRYFADSSSSSPKQFRKTVFSDTNDATALNEVDSDIPTLNNKVPHLPPLPHQPSGTAAGGGPHTVILQAHAHPSHGGSAPRSGGEAGAKAPLPPPPNPARSNSAQQALAAQKGVSTPKPEVPTTPPPPRSDLELLEKDEAKRRTKGKSGTKKGEQPISRPPTHFPEFSKFDETPDFVYDRRRRILILLASLAILSAAAGYYYFFM